MASPRGLPKPEEESRGLARITSIKCPPSALELVCVDVAIAKQGAVEREDVAGAARVLDDAGVGVIGLHLEDLGGEPLNGGARVDEGHRANGCGRRDNGDGRKLPADARSVKRVIGRELRESGAVSGRALLWGVNGLMGSVTRFG